VNLEAHVAPVFEINVELPPGGVDFANLLPNSPPETREVLVRVQSNLGKPYMVIQKVVSPLSNEKGEAIAEVAFSLKEEFIGSASGKLAHTDFKPVSPGDATLFFSDTQGSSAEFKVIYRLRAYPEMTPGDYRTEIVYSLGEM
jgi:hypothetical protein